MFVDEVEGPEAVDGPWETAPNASISSNCVDGLAVAVVLLFVTLHLGHVALGQVGLVGTLVVAPTARGSRTDLVQADDRRPGVAVDELSFDSGKNAFRYGVGPSGRRAALRSGAVAARAPAVPDIWCSPPAYDLQQGRR